MSELLKKLCSCSGNNPNCYMCGGWGYIDSVSESRIPTGQGEAAVRIRKISRRRKNMSDEDIAKRILSLDKKALQQKDIKIITKFDKLFPKNINTVIKKEICKICGEKIINDNDHILCLFVNIEHKQTPKPKDNTKNESKNKKTFKNKVNKAKAKQCLFCNNTVYKESIEYHINEYHSDSTKTEQQKIRTALGLLFIKM